MAELRVTSVEKRFGELSRDVVDSPIEYSVLGEPLTLTRDDLEAAIREYGNAEYLHGMTFDRESNATVEKMRQALREAFVLFVRDWLRQWNHSTALDSERSGDILADEWLQEMTDA